jgi:hypothetical protein
MSRATTLSLVQDGPKMLVDVPFVKKIFRSSNSYLQYNFTLNELKFVVILYLPRNAYYPTNGTSAHLYFSMWISSYLGIKKFQPCFEACNFQEVI